MVMSNVHSRLKTQERQSKRQAVDGPCRCLHNSATAPIKLPLDPNVSALESTFGAQTSSTSNEQLFSHGDHFTHAICGQDAAMSVISQSNEVKSKLTVETAANWSEAARRVRSSYREWVRAVRPLRGR